jgi:hypothetical protein
VVVVAAGLAAGPFKTEALMVAAAGVKVSAKWVVAELAA